MKKPSKIRIFIPVLIIMMCSVWPVRAPDGDGNNERDDNYFVVPSTFYSSDGSSFTRVSNFIGPSRALCAKKSGEKIKDTVVRVTFDFEYLDLPDEFEEAKPEPLDLRSTQFLIKETKKHMFVIDVLVDFKDSECIQPILLKVNANAGNLYFYRVASDEKRVHKVRYNGLRDIQSHEMGTVIFSQNNAMPFFAAMIISDENDQLKSQPMSIADFDVLELKPVPEAAMPYYFDNSTDQSFLGVFISKNVAITLYDVHFERFMWLNFDYRWRHTNLKRLRLSEEVLGLFLLNIINTIFSLIVIVIPLDNEYGYILVPIKVAPMPSDDYKRNKKYMCKSMHMSSGVQGLETEFIHLLPSKDYLNPIQTESRYITSSEIGSPVFLQTLRFSKPLLMGLIATILEGQGQMAELYYSLEQLNTFVKATTPADSDMIEISDKLRRFHFGGEQPWVPPMQNLQKLIDFLTYLSTNTSPVGSGSHKLNQAIDAMIAIYSTMKTEMDDNGHVNKEHYKEYRKQMNVLQDYFAISRF